MFAFLTVTIIFVIVWLAFNAECKQDALSSLRAHIGECTDVYVLFYIDQCPHCPRSVRRFKKARARAMHERGSHKSFAMVNAFDHLAFCRKHNIEDVPCVVRIQTMKCGSEYVVTHLGDDWHQEHQEKT